jgi:DNA-binding LacI/PurR family transcriptional regulator
MTSKKKPAISPRKRRTRTDSRPPTASDVARIAGVSQSAVSRAFTAGATVAPRTRQRILEAADLLGYRPSNIGRSLTTGKTRIIGLAIGYSDNSFFPSLIRELSKAFGSLGYRLLLFYTGDDGNSDPVLAEVLNYRVDALILASAFLSSDLASECQSAGTPVVLINRKIDGHGVVSVTADNIGGGRAIAQFLLALGHKRVAFVAGIDSSSTSRDRELGFNELMRARGVVPLRAAGNYTLEGAKRAARGLLAGPDPPDAIFFANDHMAIAGIEVARYEFGLRVGDDISIVGFDDAGPARWQSYDLTTYTQPIAIMVDHVVDCVRSMINGDGPAQEDRIVPGELVIRSSTRRPGN